MLNKYSSPNKELLDNYHELLGILEKIERKELGVVNQALNDLRTKTKAFLERYDKDENRAVDIYELTEKRKELGTDLSKENKWTGGSQLGRIVQVMKKLEENIINHRQAKTSEERSLTDKKQELAWSIIDRLEKYSASQEFDAEKAYNTKGKDNYWQEKSTWQDYLEGIAKENTKNNGFVYARENLLYPLAELIIEKLKETDVEKLLQNYEENRKELEKKFVKSVKDLCSIFQELKNEELNKTIEPLKSQVNDFAKYLEKVKINSSKEENETILKLKEEEENKLEKIVEGIKNLEEQVKTCHESLTNKEVKVNYLKEEIEEDIQQHQATIEIPIE